MNVERDCRTRTRRTHRQTGKRDSVPRNLAPSLLLPLNQHQHPSTRVADSCLTHTRSLSFSESLAVASAAFALSLEPRTALTRNSLEREGAASRSVMKRAASEVQYSCKYVCVRISNVLFRFRILNPSASDKETQNTRGMLSGRPVQRLLQPKCSCSLHWKKCAAQTRLVITLCSSSCRHCRRDFVAFPVLLIQLMWMFET